MLPLSEQVLALAPHHAETRNLRSRAWKAVEPVTVVAKPGAAPVVQQEGEKPRQRFLLWIDGVGGYLVCLDHRITFGQANPEAPVDVPLFADVSRLHATLTRDSPAIPRA